MTQRGDAATKKRESCGGRPPPVSLAPLSFEDAVRALAATPPMTGKPKRQPKPRSAKKPRRKKTD